MNKNAQIIDTELIKPKILYYGTPVILLNTLNEDDTVNISPISSSWALGEHIILGIGLGVRRLRTWNGILNVSSIFRTLPYGRMSND